MTSVLPTVAEDPTLPAIEINERRFHSEAHGDPADELTAATALADLDAIIERHSPDTVWNNPHESLAVIRRFLTARSQPNRAPHRDRPSVAPHLQGTSTMASRSGSGDAGHRLGCLGSPRSERATTRAPNRPLREGTDLWRVKVTAYWGTQRSPRYAEVNSQDRSASAQFIAKRLEVWERPLVLRAAGRSLGVDDRVEAGDAHGEPVGDINLGSIGVPVVIAVTGPRRLECHVDITEPGREVHHQRHRTKEWAIERRIDWAFGRSQPGLQLVERCAEPVEVVVVTGRHDIDVGRWQCRAVQHRREPTDHHVFNAVLVEDPTDRSGVKHRHAWSRLHAGGSATTPRPRRPSAALARPA